MSPDSNSHCLAAVLVALALVTGCGAADADRTEASAGAQATAGASAATAPVTNADLDAYARGIRKETEAVREARARAAGGGTPQERGAAIQATFDTATMPLGAEAAGMALDRYRHVRETVHGVFQTLDFQDKIDGPMSMDMSRASAGTKERLARDAFADLPAASAAVLKARMSELVPLWIEYVKLTAVAG